MVLDSAMVGTLYLPVNGSRSVLTGRECLDHTDHNRFELREGRIRGFLVLVSGFEGICP